MLHNSCTCHPAQYQRMTGTFLSIQLHNKDDFVIDFNAFFGTIFTNEDTLLPFIKKNIYPLVKKLFIKGNLQYAVSYPV